MYLIDVYNELMDKAQEAADAENYDEALNLYTKAIDCSLEISLSFFKRGEVYFYRGEYKNSLIDLDKAISLDRDDPIYYFYRAFSKFNLDFYFSRYDANGQLDTSFGIGGFVIYPLTTNVASNSPGLDLIRLNDDGLLALCVFNNTTKLIKFTSHCFKEIKFLKKICFVRKANLYGSKGN